MQRVAKTWCGIFQLRSYTFTLFMGVGTTVAKHAMLNTQWSMVALRPVSQWSMVNRTSPIDDCALQYACMQ